MSDLKNRDFYYHHHDPCHPSTMTTTTTTTARSGGSFVGLGLYVVDALLLDQYDLSRVCIETLPNEDFICTHTRDVLELREKYYYDMVDNNNSNKNEQQQQQQQSNLPLINVGITQRVDGAEHERKAIRDVLHQMDMYFFEEVLAFPEYSYARTRWYVACKCCNVVVMFVVVVVCVFVCVCVCLYEISHNHPLSLSLTHTHTHTHPLSNYYVRWLAW